MSVTSIEETSGSPLSGYTGDSVDYSSLTFVATYDDESTGSVTPASCTPSVWGEAGTETITFSFAGTDVTCEVEATVVAKALTSLAYSGTFATQTVGSAPDLTGITFTAHYNDSTLDHTVSTSDVTVSPATWAESGSQTLTMSYTDEYGTASVTATVTVEAEPVLESLSVSGSFTNPQYTGSAPDLAGLTFTATYDDTSSKSVSASDIVCTPSVWDASGNPNNLGAQNVVFTYTEDGNSVSTGINGTVIHRPNTQSIVTGSENWAYFDYLSDWGLLKSPMEVLQGGASQGDYICGFFTESDYENHTTITPEVLVGYMGTYSVMAGEGYPDGTINTAGYVPTTGLPDLTGLSLNEKYICFGVQASSATTGTFKVVVAPAVSNISAGSFSSSDFDTSDANARVYTVNIVSAP